MPLDYVVGCIVSAMAIFASTIVGVLGRLEYAMVFLGLVLAIIVVPVFFLGKWYRLDLRGSIIFLVGALIFSVHMAQGSSLIDEGEMLVMLSFAVFSHCFLTCRAWRYLTGTILVAACVLCINALTLVPAYAASGLPLSYMRLETILDKPSFTLLFTLSVVFLAVTFMSGERRWALGGIVCTLAICAMGWFVIESKSFFLVSLLVLAVCGLVFGSLEAKVLVIVAAVAILFAVPQVASLAPDAIPDALKSILNNYFGYGFTYDPVYDKTYAMRSEITNFALSLADGRWLFGIGFGGFGREVALSDMMFSGHVVTETESSFLSFLVEGGALYLLMQLYMNTAVMVSAWRISRNSETRLIGHQIFALALAFFTLNIFNDFATPFYWCFLTVCFGVVRFYGGDRRAATRVPSNMMAVNQLKGFGVVSCRD